MHTEAAPALAEPGRRERPHAGRNHRAAHGRGPRHKTLRWLGAALLLPVLAIVVCAAVLVRDALTARDALLRAANDLPAVERALAEGVLELGGTSLADIPELARLQRHTDLARASTDGPLWAAAARLPVIGPTVEAATTVSIVVDEITDTVIPALTTAGDAVGATRRTADGGLDLAPLEAAAPEVAAATATLTELGERMAAMDTAALRPELAGPVADLQLRLTELQSMLGTADRAASLLPTALGANGPRTYLVLALTNAELRAGGGIPGGLILVRADGGHVDVVRQAASSDVPPFDEPVLPLDADDVALHTERLGLFVQDVTSTPDFPTTGRLAAEMWARSQGERVDGVLATDPVALSYLLDATGPVDVALPRGLARALGTDSVEVSSSDVVDLLLRRVYDVLEPRQADRFFAVVTSAVFDRVTGDDVEVAALLPALRRAAEEHRLRTWSPEEDVQARLDGTVLAGTFAAAPRAADAVGVFLADGVAGKMSAYLDSSVEHTGSRCTADGRVDTLEVRLASTAPADAATSLPRYVAGLPGGASPPGTLRLNVDVMSPRGAAVPRLERDDAPFGGRETTAHDRATVVTTVVLAPGDSTALRIEVPANAAAARGAGAAPAGELDVWSTPTVTTPGLRTYDVPTCG